GEPDGLLGRQCQRLIVRVRVQRLGPAEHRCQSLHGDPDHVVEWLLGGERYTARLGVEAESGGLVARAVPLAHEARPEATCGTELRDLLEQVVVRREEERESRGEPLERQPARECALDVLERVGEREGDLLRRGRAGLANMVAADRDRVPARYLPRTEIEDVGNEPQA